jgi:hypothetical protein
VSTVHRGLAVLRVSDARVFDEIRAVLPFDEHVLGWISPTEAIVDPSTLRSLLDQLDGRGMKALVKRAGPGFGVS